MTLFIPYKRKRGEGEVGNIDTDIGDKYMRIGHGCMAGTITASAGMSYTGSVVV
jgi:hypothetical protein